MKEPTRGRAWERYLAKRHPSGPAREAFDHEVRAVTAAAELVSSIESFRSSMNISKSEVARRLGKQLSAVSRSLTADDSNPTIVTLLEMLDAMGVRVILTVEPRVSDDDPLLNVRIQGRKRLTSA